MRFFLDQDVSLLTCRLLREAGHPCVRASEVRLSRAPDERILSTHHRCGGQYSVHACWRFRDPMHGKVFQSRRLPQIALKFEPSSFNAIPCHAKGTRSTTWPNRRF